jgi:hypothetical protein
MASLQHARGTFRHEYSEYYYWQRIFHPLHFRFFVMTCIESSTSLFHHDVKKEDNYDDITRILGEEMMRIDQEAEEILYSIRSEDRFLQKNSTISQYSNFNYECDDDDDDVSYFEPNDLDDETDDEIHKEILNLGTVTANLRQDLDDVGVESLEKHFSESHSVESYRYSSFTMELEAVSQLLCDSKLSGLGIFGKGHTSFLLTFTLVIWSVFLILLLYIQYSDTMNEKAGNMMEY